LEKWVRFANRLTRANVPPGTGSGLSCFLTAHWPFLPGVCPFLRGPGDRVGPARRTGTGVGILSLSTFVTSCGGSLIAIFISLPSGNHQSSPDLPMLGHFLNSTSMRARYVKAPLRAQSPLPSLGRSRRIIREESSWGRGARRDLETGLAISEIWWRASLTGVARIARQTWAAQPEEVATVPRRPRVALRRRLRPTGATRFHLTSGRAISDGFQN
jgi:hypothetical protein